MAARRASAASRAARLSAAADAALLSLVGKSPQAQYLYDSALQVSQRAIDVALQRMRFSAVPLSQRIYNTSVWMNGRLGKLINETLASGLNAREFAARARDWFNPNTPGGVRYAAMRLARTEINNAFHSISAQKYAETPWINQVDWNLSGSHSTPDECDLYARQSPFPAEEVPARPHPQCLCNITPRSVGEDEFVENFLKGDYDEYLDGELEKNGWNAPENASRREEAEPVPAPSSFISAIKSAIDSGIKSVQALTGGVAADTALVETNDGTKLVRKIMSDGGISGFPQLRNAKRQADAEELSSAVLRAIGGRAPEVYRQGDNEIYMEFIDDASTAFGARINIAGEDRIAKDFGWEMGLFDTICSNVDRNGGNWLVRLKATKEESAVFPIDHGFAFAFDENDETNPSPFLERFGSTSYPASPFYRMTHKVTNTFAPVEDGSWVDNDFSPADVEAFRRALVGLEGRFTALGRRDWWEISMRRLAAFEPYAKGTESHFNA